MPVSPVMGTNPQIPALMRRELLVALGGSLLVAQPGVINRDFEGDFATAGDTVRITTLADPTVEDYDRIAGLGEPERLEVADETFTIDQAKKFDFLIDDIELAQVADKAINSKALQQAAFRLAAAADNHVVGKILAAAGTKETVTIAAPEEFYDNVVVGTGLVAQDDAGVDPNDRVLVVNAAGRAKLLLDKRFVANGSEASDTRLLNGQVGTVAGYRVVVSRSPQLAGKAVFVTSTATTYADQVNRVRSYESQTHFGVRTNGLHVYGAKVTKPEQLVVVSWS